MPSPLRTAAEQRASRGMRKPLPRSARLKEPSSEQQPNAHTDILCRSSHVRQSRRDDVAILKGEQKIGPRTVNHITHRAGVSSQSGIEDVLPGSELTDLFREWIVESVPGVKLYSRLGLQAKLTSSADIIQSPHERRWILQHVGVHDALAAAGAETAERLSAENFAFETQAMNQRNLPICRPCPAIYDAIESPILPTEVAAEIERRGMVLIFAARPTNSSRVAGLP